MSIDLLDIMPGSSFPPLTPRVLLVGAYERDNYGDLLFLLVTERYLPDAHVVAAAPFRADMTALLDREIPAYGPLLERERFDVVWTVGGQVGAIDLPRAYRRYLRGSARRRAAILRRAVGGAPVVSPYIPAPVDYPLNAGVVTVLNSAGLAGLRHADPEHRRHVVSVLRGQTFVAVRDRASSDFLARRGIAHRLVPDAVHALGVLAPAERDRDSDVAIVQASRSALHRLGHATVAARLAASPQLRGLKLRLLPAGTAPGHDSVADYEALARQLRRAAPRADVAILETRRPLELVDHIRRARVVIGTSLHVRIVASAYGVPRVTLAKRKPTEYARTWDSDMPFDVSLAGLDHAIEAAVARAGRPESAARSDELARRAHEHLAGLADGVMTMARTQTPADAAKRADARRRRRARSERPSCRPAEPALA